VRFLLGVDKAILSEMTGAFLRTVFWWYRLRAQRLGVRGAEPGAVTFVQRFGGGIKLNPPIHALLTDGVFVEGEDGRATYLALPPPTDAEVQALAERLAKRLGAIARRRLAEAGRREWDPDRAAVHALAGEALRLPLRRDGHDEPGRKALCARVDDFSLHAARAVEPGDRAGLERLCRYGLRPPFSQERLSLDPDGRVRCRLLRPWPTPDGRQDLVLEPVAVLRRLAALIPAPRQHLVLYHGVFASRSRFRRLLPEPPPSGRRSLVPVPSPGPGARPTTASAEVPRARDRPPRRIPWAQILKRVLDIEALTCPKCRVPMLKLAFLTDPGVVRRILDHLNASRPAAPRPRAHSATGPGPRVPARRPGTRSALTLGGCPCPLQGPPSSAAGDARASPAPLARDGHPAQGTRASQASHPGHLRPPCPFAHGPRPPLDPTLPRWVAPNQGGKSA